MSKQKKFKGHISAGFRYFFSEWSIPTTRYDTMEDVAISGIERSACNDCVDMQYRRQSPEYAAWLRAKGLPVGEVHDC